MTTMKITALAPYFGGKRNMAADIIAELGPHRVYWEPFCGSAAVLLQKPACVMETICDLNGDLTNLARVVQNREMSRELWRRLCWTTMNETMHREAAERWRERGYAGDGRPDVDAAYDYFVCCWQGRNGVAGTSSYKQGFCARYTANGGHAATRWSSVVRSIPAWRERLLNVMIMTRSAFDVLPKIDDSGGTVIYCDPPYIEKGAKYIHDFTETDHNRLAELLHRFKKTRVVVSYYEHPRLNDLYPGWTRRHFEVSKAMAHQGRRGENNTKAVEVLLINGLSRVNDNCGLWEPAPCDA